MEQYPPPPAPSQIKDGKIVARVASVSVPFRRKERGTRIKDREKSGAKSSVFISSQTKRKRLLRGLQFSNP